MTRAELVSRMSNREFQEWFVYEQLHPFGEKREDLRAGIVWAMTVNIHRDPQRSKAVTAEQYPLIEHAKTEQEKANDLHRQFLAFKHQYETRKALDLD